MVQVVGTVTGDSRWAVVQRVWEGSEGSGAGAPQGVEEPPVGEGVEVQGRGGPGAGERDGPGVGGEGVVEACCLGGFQRRPRTDEVVLPAGEEHAESACGVLRGGRRVEEDDGRFPYRRGRVVGQVGGAQRSDEVAVGVGVGARGDDELGAAGGGQQRCFRRLVQGLVQTGAEAPECVSLRSCRCGGPAQLGGEGGGETGEVRGHKSSFRQSENAEIGRFGRAGDRCGVRQEGWTLPRLTGNRQGHRADRRRIGPGPPGHVPGTQTGRRRSSRPGDQRPSPTLRRCSRVRQLSAGLRNYGSRGLVSAHSLLSW